MPFGRLPTLIRLSSLKVVRSITETSSLLVFVTKSCLPLGLNDSPCVHVPRGSYFTNFSVAISMMDSWLDSWSQEITYFPSGDTPS